MPKACFDKMDPKPTLIQTYALKVNNANSNSLIPVGTTMCTLEFPQKFQQQLIVCKHLLRSIVLGLDNYLTGIDWFSTKQLHLCQGPQSIVVLDPTPFSLHINQVSTLPPPHLLVTTIT